MEQRVIEKFWEGVEKTPTCWHWTAFNDKAGLPVIRFGHDADGNKRMMEFSARRISLELSGKVILPSDRAQPLICKNKLCVNPAHLVIGDEARFWAKVQRLTNDDCWIWTASFDKNMYGKFLISEEGKDRSVRAHVYSWELYTGRPVPKGVQVCHKCDHSYCVNPDHLFLGTTQDNTQDKIDKGRQAKGESIGLSILTEKEVIEIRELHKAGHTIMQLSILYGRGRNTIGDVIKRRTWKHIP